MSVDMNKPGEGAATQQLAPVAPLAYRMPRVNLLPPEIGQAQTLKRTQVFAGVGVIAVVGLLAGGYLLTALDAGRASDQLRAEQATSAQLNTEKAKYAEVTAVKNEVEAVKQARQTAMSADVLWASQVDQIVSEMPADMTFKSMTIAFYDDGKIPDAETNPLANPNAVGSIKVEAIGTNHSTAAAWLEAGARHPGFVNPYLTTSAYGLDDTKVKTLYTSELRFTPELYSGRYEPGGSANPETGKVG